MTSEFLGYTIGLECWANDKLVLVTVEFTQQKDSVVLRAVSGRNLSRLRWHIKRISLEEYEDRPEDPYDSTVEAIWALRQLGLNPAALDTENNG